MAPNTVQNFQLTAGEFEKLVTAERVDNSGRYQFVVDGSTDSVRLKRAKEWVNQIHLHFGEPVVVHEPVDGDSDRWFVLPLDWLIKYAICHPKAAQHTVHALDCFRIATVDLDSAFAVDPTKLSSGCEDAIRAARGRKVQRAVRTIQRARRYSQLQFEAAADDASAQLE